jgi:Transglycosylase SLT domain
MVKILAAATMVTGLPLAVILLAVAVGPAPAALPPGSPSRGTDSVPAASGQYATPGPVAKAAIPPAYLALYVGAARTCPGLPWTVLAGIGTVESDNGQSPLPGVESGRNYAGAEGPMQFLPATFAQYAVDADPGQPVTPYDPADAIYAAAAMLCAAGARGGSTAGIEQAVFAYNHASWYVAEVMAKAASYDAPAPAPQTSR